MVGNIKIAKVYFSVGVSFFDHPRFATENTNMEKLHAARDHSLLNGRSISSNVQTDYTNGKGRTGRTMTHLSSMMARLMPTVIFMLAMR